ncbi:MAG: phosphoglycerate kinase [Alphaproteobacteria bacterium]
MAALRTLDDLEVGGKRVLVRADLNLPLNRGRVADTLRIERLAPTLMELIGGGARVVVLSHFGRPQGRVVAELSLRPVVAPLSAALGGKEVAFADDCVGAEAEAVVAALGDGEVALLENLRFHAGEESNDPDFVARLAALGELYVNDAFSCAHRAHGSVVGLPRLLPAAAGRGMEAELEALGAALEAAERPLMAVVGGAKVSTKLELLHNLVAKVDVLVIGGGMANTFLHARGLEIGRSLAEQALAETARAVIEHAALAACELVLPVDVVVAEALEPGAATATVAADRVPAKAMILDIGPKTAALAARKLEDCRTLLWNGPLGAFETPPFDRGTTRLARAAAALTEAGRLMSVAGGGDTLAALNHAGVAAGFSYLSAAGGAFLEWLEGRELPGVKALEA